MRAAAASRVSALIVGAGPGLSAALARACAADGMAVALAARDVAKLEAICAETGARAYPCDASDAGDVTRLFNAVAADRGFPDLVVYNASGRVRGPIAGLEPEAVKQAMLVSAFGGFLVGQAAARGMEARGSGTILFTGASASVKGFPGSAPFAMGKFALRGLAESMARELQPKNIHVAHFIIDGGIGKQDDPRAADRGPDGLLDPDAIAHAYLQTHRQHRSAWSFEVALRPWSEKF
jgi:NAD(P)-dependent dehydrogenase (short-subunit alcohol dehydrogenase family)